VPWGRGRTSEGQEPVHLLVVADDDVVLDVGLGGRDAELHQADLGVLHAGWAPRSLAGLVVEHCARDHGGVVHRAAQLAHHLYVLQVQAAVLNIYLISQ